MNEWESLNTTLNRFTDNVVKFRRDSRTKALKCWRPIVDGIVDYVKRKDDRFHALSVFHKGSYYERSKVGEPDEFDLMLVMDNLELYDEPFEEDDGLSEPPIGFTTVMIDQGEEKPWETDECVNGRGMLNATQVKAVFKRLADEAIQDMKSKGHWRDVTVTVKSGGTAVTLEISKDGREYSVDLTLGIKDNTWPEDAEEWKTRQRKGWPKRNLVHDIHEMGCHLVTKQPKGHSPIEQERGFLWCYSFSEAEKKLFLQGEQGEVNSCRRQVLRILKALREELELQPLKSYHLKTLLLYECESQPSARQWSKDALSERFLDLLKRLEKCLRSKECPHYFIKDLNLFEMLNPKKCDELADRVNKILKQPGQVLIRLIK